MDRIRRYRRERQDGESESPRKTLDDNLSEDLILERLGEKK